MGLRYRTIRAAGSALLVAAAVGTAGMGGMTSALAADPLIVTLGGTVVDGSSRPVANVHLVINEELPPDGGLAAFQVTTAADGAFSADVYAWGTAAAPASLSIRTPADEVIEIVGESCSQTYGVVVEDRRDIAFADGAPDPFTLSAVTTLLGEVCGTTGTPGGGTGTGTDSGTGSNAQITPPPTDVAAAEPQPVRSDRLGPLLSIGFVAGLLLAGLLVMPRRRARRRH